MQERLLQSSLCLLINLRDLFKRYYRYDSAGCSSAKSFLVVFLAVGLMLVTILWPLRSLAYSTTRRRRDPAGSQKNGLGSEWNGPQEQIQI